MAFEPKFDPVTSEPLSGYVAFYGSKRAEFWAPSLYAAKQMAVKHFKPAKSKDWLISITLAVRHDGSEVVHKAVD